jgi:hypothetical protein
MQIIQWEVEQRVLISKLKSNSRRAELENGNCTPKTLKGVRARTGESTTTLSKRSTKGGDTNNLIQPLNSIAIAMNRCE